MFGSSRHFRPAPVLTFRPACSPGGWLSVGRSRLSSKISRGGPDSAARSRPSWARRDEHAALHQWQSGYRQSIHPDKLPYDAARGLQPDFIGRRCCDRAISSTTFFAEFGHDCRNSSLSSPLAAGARYPTWSATTGDDSTSSFRASSRMRVFRSTKGLLPRGLTRSCRNLAEAHLHFQLLRIAGAGAPSDGSCRQDQGSPLTVRGVLLSSRKFRSPGAGYFRHRGGQVPRFPRASGTVLTSSITSARIFVRSAPTRRKSPPSIRQRADRPHEHRLRDS